MWQGCVHSRTRGRVHACALDAHAVCRVFLAHADGEGTAVQNENRLEKQKAVPAPRAPTRLPETERRETESRREARDAPARARRAPRPRRAPPPALPPRARFSGGGEAASQGEQGEGPRALSELSPSVPSTVHDSARARSPRARRARPEGSLGTTTSADAAEPEGERRPRATRRPGDRTRVARPRGLARAPAATHASRRRRGLGARRVPSHAHAHGARGSERDATHADCT